MSNTVIHATKTIWILLALPEHKHVFLMKGITIIITAYYFPPNMYPLTGTVV